jgi:hypothetical protein
VKLSSSSEFRNIFRLIFLVPSLPLVLIGAVLLVFGVFKFELALLVVYVSVFEQELLQHVATKKVCKFLICSFSSQFLLPNPLNVV